MLKIKDNINLKELEKFGFINGYFNLMRKNTNEDDICWNETFIDKNTRIIYERLEPCGNSIFEIDKENKYIQDLIQSGLVEKV